MSTIPRGAHAILKAREAGQRPALPVIVSLVGPLSEMANPVVEVQGPAHDWRALAGLECYVYVTRASQYVQETLRGLARVAAAIWLWDVEAKRGLDLWPVWKGVNVPEVPGFLSVESRREAVFLRFGKCVL